jgi:hypothetical protein
MMSEKVNHNSNRRDIVIVGGARDYHVMDWLRTIRSLSPSIKVSLLTDLIGGESYKVLINENDVIEKLFIIDGYLFNKPNSVGDIWRNFFKLLALPVQVQLLKKYAIEHPNSIFHAQPMYYMFLCWMAGVEFIGTPQGSELLVRSERSKLYRYFASKTLKAARIVTVDSQSMKSKVYELSNRNALVIQNGIDLREISAYKKNKINKTVICSIRGLTPLYRIEEILLARNVSKSKSKMTFVYPFFDEVYKKKINSKLLREDSDIGMLDKSQLYQLLLSALLVISIPKSDSSPRSVYESIFLGACVAVTPSPWIDALPTCMKKRLIVIDLDKPDWFDEALDFANNLSTTLYYPSEEAIEMFDQERTMKNAIELLYK